MTAWAGVVGVGRAGRRAAVDVGLPVATGLLLLGVVDESPHPISDPLRTVTVVVVLVQSLALLRRRSHPRAVMVITVAGSLVVQLVVPEGLLPYAGLVALWSLAAAGPLLASLLALGALLGVTGLCVGAVPPGDAAFALAIVVVVWSLGEATRSRLVAGEQAAFRAVAQEQARLAREVHDVVAHSVSVMVVQAAAADDVFDARPDAARPALRSIEATGREALAELRRLLAAIGPSTEAGAQLRPARTPDLDRLDELVDPVRALGLAVDVRREIEPGLAVPAAVGQSAYRIVQEALTNTVRHARASRVEVLVRAAAAELEVAVLEVSVLDDGRGAGAGADGAGRGLAGMRERAALLGGSLDAGPAPGGGFRVRALLPVGHRS
jgi:signal transduction histidine kinase